MRIQKDRCERFRQLSQSFFVLPTIWDSLSATAAHSVGFKAVATSSGAVGFANGYPAGQPMGRDEMLDRIRAIVNSVDIAVSVDLEHGYPDAKGDITETIELLLESGAVALNIEDSLGSHTEPLIDAERHADKVRLIRRIAERAGKDLFINARTDVFVLDPVPPTPMALREAIDRGNRYVDAGADGVYVMASDLSDETVHSLASGLRGGLTLRAPRKTADFGAWRALGVRRVSLGTAPIRGAFNFLQTSLESVRRQESLSQLTVSAGHRSLDESIRAARGAA